MDAAREVSVYALIDPRDGLPRYVGRSRDPKKRLGQHLRDRGGERGAWIAALEAEGLRPEVKVLSVAPESDGEWLEQWWIDGLRDDGCMLLNRARVCELERVAISLVPSDAEWLSAYVERNGSSLALALMDAIGALVEREEAVSGAAC